MRKFATLFCLLVAVGVRAAETPDPQTILARSDAIRNPDRPFSLRVDLLEYRQGKEKARSVLQVYSRADTGSGQYRSLVRFVEPARDTNKLMLRNNQDLWFYDPASAASVRISPQQRLLGQASNGDVVTTNLARDYRAELVDAEPVKDALQKERRAWHLKLTATTPLAYYPQAELWIEQDSYRPIKGRFFADSGQLLKTAWYRRFEPQLGAERPVETVIVDGLDPGWITLMRFSAYAWREVPEAWLQRDYLPRFRPE